MVTLEAYAEENRTLIHNNRNDEAIAICKHILNYYPKHIESYRQMGEAHLEKDELEPAVDLFRRVLSADPENVIAYVGLATAFEKQHLIEEAVWHLERADEMEPGNIEIHKELLRLYGEAGKPRQRLKLSPAGLARLYDQEGLYSQAIQELRAIVDATPSRYDARTALAETLWHAGRVRESAEIAQNILTSLPYCLKANLILGTAWKESGLADYETYLNRAQELDPTHKIAVRLLGTRSPLVVTEVSVPRYIQGATPPPMPRPSPVSSTPTTTEPIKPLVEEPATSATDFVTETLTAEEEAPASPPVEPETEPTIKPNLPGANLPPWLVSEFPESAETATPIETPPASSKPGSEPGTFPVESMANELPPWLRGESLAQPPSEPTLAESPETPSEQLPTWLPNAAAEASALSRTEEQSQVEEPKPAEDIPDWLRGLEAEPARTEEPAATEEYVLPSFLAPENESEKATEEPAAQESPLISPVDSGPAHTEEPTATEEYIPSSFLAPENEGQKATEEPAAQESPLISSVDSGPAHTEEPTATEEYVLPSFLAPESERATTTEEPAAQESPVISSVDSGPARIEEPAATEEYVLPSFLAQENEGATETEEPAARDSLVTYGHGMEPAAEKPAQDLQASAPTPTIEEYAPVPAEEAAESQPAQMAEPVSAPPIVVEMPTASPAPSERASQIEAPSVTQATAPSPTRKRQPKGYDHLVLARKHRGAGQTDDALAEYDYIVLHAPRLVKEVIDDLEMVIAQPDAPLEAHRILGDAYTRADRLSEALQRYQYVLGRTARS